MVSSFRAVLSAFVASSWIRGIAGCHADLCFVGLPGPAWRIRGQLVCPGSWARILRPARVRCYSPLAVGLISVGLGAEQKVEG